MTEYDVYREYVALKRHFSSSYDYFKYNGKTRVSVDTYKKRRDKFFFQKLSKEKDPHGLLVSNLVYTDKWIGDMCLNEESYKIYRDWMRVNQSLSYVFENELSKLGDVKSAIVTDGSLPKAFMSYYKGEIHLETLVVLSDVCRCYSYWTNNLKDDPLASDTLRKIHKYKPFMKYDREKMKAIARKYLTSK